MIDLPGAHIRTRISVFQQLLDLVTTLDRYGFDPRLANPLADFVTRQLLVADGHILDDTVTTDDQRNVSGG